MVSHFLMHCTLPTILYCRNMVSRISTQLRLLQREHAYKRVQRRVATTHTQKKTFWGWTHIFLPAFQSHTTYLRRRIERRGLYSIVISWTWLDMVVRFRRKEKKKLKEMQHIGKGDERNVLHTQIFLLISWHIMKYCVYTPLLARTVSFSTQDLHGMNSKEYVVLIAVCQSLFSI